MGTTCRKCGKELKPGVRFCNQCGTPIDQPQQEQSAQMSGYEQKTAPRPAKKRRAGLIAIVAVCVVLLAVGGGFLAMNFLGENEQSGTSYDWDASTSIRPQLLDFTTENEPEELTPSVPAYEVAAGLSNVENLDQFYLSENQLELLEENMFVVSSNWYSEFFENYEYNRYAYIPNFVTVDSMMHTYHLYFSLLLNRTEKNHLADDLQKLSLAMMQTSEAQYEELKNTEWEEAALRNVAFFAVALKLQNPSQSIPNSVAAMVEQEVSLINDASGIATSSMTDEFMDYSQYKPRGYYAGDEVLERYFRAMMWYGQVNFGQDTDVLNRSAALMTMAMADDNLKIWERIYAITTVFAGASDDLTYYEYAPVLEEAYGAMPAAADLIGKNAEYEAFLTAIKELPPPAINSIPVLQTEEGDPRENHKGFRFMGQRFSIDAAIMQQLVYRQVKETENDEKRMLPDTLDVAAALGSDTALELLKQTDVEKYPNYLENMEFLRKTAETAPENSWTTTLYSSWLYTLKPLLEEKGEGYPSFMRSEEWQKKTLETFAGSYAELKHDTVLYSKQVMAEMGGGPPEELDDRGYVEPEVEVFRRFALLAEQTANGLSGYGMISDQDLENLVRLQELAEKFETISRKELRNETLTDAEYELIRSYGGTLEHFWEEAVREKAPSEYLDTKEIPASLATDIATDPDAGRVLQIATGKPAEILVIVPVDGKLRIASGVVYNFYQFEQPMSERLTDAEWRYMSGEWMRPDGTFTRWEDRPEKPWWTTSYWGEE